MGKEDLDQESMTNLFESSQIKIDWAKQHIKNLERQIIAFFDEHPYEKVIESDSQSGYKSHKIRLTKSLPVSFALITADAVNNLRAALDHICYSTAVAGGTQNPKHCAFPFAGDAAHFVKALGKCKDVPQQIQACLGAFQPYRGGNDLLWALNDVCNMDKHFLVTPAAIGNLSFSYGPLGADIIRENSFWDRVKNEIELFKTRGDPQYDVNFAFTITFKSPQVLKGKQLLRALGEFVDIVERILVVVEAEAGRIGLVK